MIVAFLAEISAMVDAKVRSFLKAGDHEAALRVVLDVFGTELHGFVLALLRDERAASEVYAQLRADLLRVLPSYRGETGVRTWSYALARRAALDRRTDRHRGAPLSDVMAAERHLRSSISELSAKTGATPHEEELSEQDREIYLLRVGRAFGWEDIARIVVTGAAPMAPREISRRAAALQRRFDEIKGAFVRDHTARAAPRRRATRSRA